MARPALSAARGLDILDLMAAFPGRAFTLSDVVRATGINLASVHAILSALAERGYVERVAGQKAFVLGAVPLALGEAALRSQPMVARAREVAAELAMALDAPVLLTAAVGVEMVAVHAVSDPAGRWPGLRTGERRPMVPPLGAPFIAWEDEAAIAGWLARGAHAGEPDFAAEQRLALQRIRERGFQLSLRSPGSPRLTPDPGDGIAGFRDRMIGLVDRLRPEPGPAVIDPAGRYEVMLIAAPVFARSGRCAFNLCLGDFARALSGAEVLSHAEKLVTASLAIMQADTV